MGWRILYVESSDFLSLHLDNIVVDLGDDCVKIPITDIHTVLIDNYKTTISSHLINALTKSNVSIIICGLNHMPESIILPLFGHYSASYILKEQIGWKNDEKQLAHQLIIKRKITNQLKLLEYLKCDQYAIELLKNYINDVTLGDQTNREGLASKVYFRSLYGENFKRFNDDVMNAGLNYGYSLLRSAISKSIVSKGLNSSIGIFHRGQTNAFNLSDDLIEIFRPLVDLWVYKKLKQEKIFLREHRIEILKILTISTLVDNKRHSLIQSIDLWTHSIQNYLNNSESTIKEIELLYHEL
jgi:CRISP-associated protein Cas1